MTTTLNGLILDTQMFALEELDAALQPEIQFEYLDIVNSVHKAIQYHMDMDFQICLISEQFPREELKSFFADYEKLAKKSVCVFVQFRDHLNADFERTSLKNIGFSTVITKNGTKDDKDALEIALKEYWNQKEYEEILGGLPDVVGYLMGEIDKIALEKKRGKDKDLSTIFSDHLKDSSKKFDGLRQDYLEKLIETSDNAQAFKTTKLDVPENVVSKQLPGLTKEGYKGQSHRVFNKLLNIHGDKKEKK
jgi:hypothetical protein